MNNNSPKQEEPRCPHSMYEWKRVDPETMVKYCCSCGTTLETKTKKVRKYN
jgi:hypothetical protein